MRNEIVLMLSGCSSSCEIPCHWEKSNVRKEPSSIDSTACAWPWKSKVSARRAVQTLTACQRRLSTSTCWFSSELIRLSHATQTVVQCQRGQQRIDGSLARFAQALVVNASSL